MALPATLVWEVRTSNGTTNGAGGFDPAVASAGTDFSQQDAVQKAYTDLVIDATTNTDVTSVSRPFTSVDVGNNIAITGGGAGWTNGIYNIRSLQAGSKARLDRAVGTLGSTGGIGSFGGARLSYNGGTTPLQGVLVSGNTVWVKKEVVWNEAISLTTGGTGGNPVTHIGYNATRGDITESSATWANRPTNDRGVAGTDGINISGGQHILKFLRVRRAGTNGIRISGGVTNLLFCRFDTNTSNGVRLDVGCYMYACEIDTNGSGVLGVVSGPQTVVDSCYVHDNTGVGVDVTNNTRAMVMNSIIEANGGHGISVGASCTCFIQGNTIDGNTGATTDGINVGTPSAGGENSVLVNNIFSNNGRYGANFTDGDSVYSNFNCFFGNGTAARNNLTAGANDSTSDPTYTNRGAGNFALGVSLTGYPGVFPGATSTGFRSMGAVQPAAGGSAAGMIVHPGMAGGMRG